jgi:hypothetical protein
MTGPFLITVTFPDLKAAPRFELGVQVLQTRALPLGYAAATNSILPLLTF